MPLLSLSWTTAFDAFFVIGFNFPIYWGLQQIRQTAKLYQEAKQKTGQARRYWLYHLLKCLIFIACGIISVLLILSRPHNS